MRERMKCHTTYTIQYNDFNFIRKLHIMYKATQIIITKHMSLLFKYLFQSSKHAGSILATIERNI
jgi:hypothetical protein